MPDSSGMSTIVRVVTRWLLGLVLVFGVAVTLFEHMTPGGGFVGGVAVACGFVLATLAFGGKSAPAVFFERLTISLIAVGGLLFLTVALVGYFSGAFFERWLPIGTPFSLQSTPGALLLNVAILLLVSAGGFAGFVAIARFGHWSEGDDKGGGS